MPAKSKEFDTLLRILKSLQEQSKTLHTIAHELREIKVAVTPIDRSESTPHNEGDSEVES